MKELFDDFRLMICGILFGWLITLAPKGNAEGDRIIALIQLWARMEKRLREAAQ